MKEQFTIESGTVDLSSTSERESFEERMQRICAQMGSHSETPSSPNDVLAWGNWNNWDNRSAY